MGRRWCMVIVAAALPFAVWAVLPIGSAGQSADSLQRKIERKRDQIEARKRRERVLSSDVSAFTSRIGALQSEITRLQTKQVRLEADLNAKRVELSRLQEELRGARLRLARLRARLAEARAELASRLVEIYKAGTPDLVSVALNADGFTDLLERAEFMQRVSAHDARIIGRVQDAKTEATAIAERLSVLERRAAQVAAAIEADVTQVAAVKGELVDRRSRFAAARAAKSRLLDGVRADRRVLERHVAGLERQQARVIAALRRAATGDGGSGVAGPPRTGSGALMWPVSAAISSGFGWRWGRLHAGLDLPVPEGTPIRAAASGRVVLMQPTSASGGYGNYTCVQHSGGLATCYAHQSRFGTTHGASVGQGQVIGYSGNTGNSTGPHLHFETRVNGQPVDPLGYL